jgi:hypothetical protein
MGRFTAIFKLRKVPDAMIDAAITMAEDCPAEALTPKADV